MKPISAKYPRKADFQEKSHWEQNKHETRLHADEKHIFIRLLYQIRIKNQTIFIAMRQKHLRQSNAVIIKAIIK